MCVCLLLILKFYLVDGEDTPNLTFVDQLSEKLSEHKGNCSMLFFSFLDFMITKESFRFYDSPCHGLRLLDYIYVLVKSSSSMFLDCTEK